MQGQLNRFGLLALLLTVSAMAQQAVTTSGGTTNSVPMFSNSTTLSTSPISVFGNNVGIGTGSPANALSVNGDTDIGTRFKFDNPGGFGGSSAVFGLNGTSGNKRFLFYDYVANTPLMVINDQTSGGGVLIGSGYITSNATPDVAPVNGLAVQGNVGIGTASPQTPLDVGKLSGTSLFAGVTVENPITDGNYNSPMLLLGSGGWFNNGQFLRAAALQAVNDNWNVGQKALAFYTYDGHLGNNFTSATLADLYERMRISSSGNVGIGTTSPGAKLEVDGNIRLTSGSGASIMFADGTVQSTAWTGSLCGGDYAEAVDVSGERKQYEPGDVLVIDPSHPGNFLKSTEPYSRLVAGIYSTKPGLIGRRQTTTDPKLRAEEVPMAMVGIVPTKVTAENGPIEVGDLMVTSSQPGYAMKGTDGLMKTGTVIGKALGSLSSGTGVIEVLVSLQ